MPVLAPCIPLLPCGTVPPLLLLFILWLPLLSCTPLCTRALRVPSAPLCVSPAAPRFALISCHAIAPLLTSDPLDSDGPVCTILSAVSPVAVLSPLCATRVFYPCQTLLSLPFSLVSCRNLTLHILLCFCPLSLCFVFIPGLSRLPGRHGSMARGGGSLADWIVALLVDGLDDGRLGSDDRDFPHAAGTSEPPVGSTVANAILIGPALRAGNVGAPRHLRLLATMQDPTLSIPASASGIAAQFLTTARRTPPAHQYSTPVHLYFSIMSGFSLWAALYAASTILPASRRPAAPSAPSVLPYSAAPAAVAADPVPLAGVLVRVRHHHIPLLPGWPPSTAARVPTISCSPAPLRAFPPLLVSSTPSLYHLLRLGTPRVLPSCSPPCPSSARPSCTPRVPGAPVVMMMSTAVLLPPRPRPHPRTTPPAATAPAASGQSRLTAGSASPSILLHQPPSISGPPSLGLPALLTGSLKGLGHRLSRPPLVPPAHFT